MNRDNIPVRRGSGKAPIRHWWVAFCWLVVAGCSSVAQMQARYEAGDTSQYDKILAIAARPDYPYATRKSAAVALGEIGDRRAVPVLVGILGEFDQRTTLKQEAMVALGRIGDRGAVTAIGRLLDRSLGDTNDELRMAAMPVLADLGGPEAATLLINALRYYDIVTLQREGRVPRGVFSGDEQSMRDYRDSLMAPADRATVNPLGTGLESGLTGGGGGLFGPNVRLAEQRPDSLPQERALAHVSLVGVGEAAVPVIEEVLATEEITRSLDNELRSVIAEIHGETTPAETPEADGAEAGGADAAPETGGSG